MALTKPSILPSVCSQISGPVVRTWISRLATLSNWLAKIAPSGCSPGQPRRGPAGDLHIIIVVAVRHCGNLQQRCAERAKRVLLFLRLRFRDDDDGFQAQRIGDDGESDAGVARRSVDHQPALAQFAPVDRIADDPQCSAVLDRRSRVHEFGLAQDSAAGHLRCAAKLDQRRIADRCEDGVSNLHRAYVGSCQAVRKGRLHTTTGHLSKSRHPSRPLG